ncbi:MAG: hypothetical protein RQ736_13480 [Thiogranum sp.]|nr:hypothetical protein [Thiogranum sp.]
MSVHRNPITGYPALKWLLVMVLVFAPLQGARSALEDGCHSGHAMMAAEASGSGPHAAADTDATQEQCLCDHCDDGGICKGACDCNAAAVSAFQVGFAPLPVNTSRPPLQARVLEPFFSQFVSPLLHPPQN